MTETARTVQRTYLVLTLFTTLSASFIWGINTLFLLDAGLDPITRGLDETTLRSETPIA